MIIVFDLDKTLCSPLSRKDAYEEVKDCKPVEHMVKAIRELKTKGHKIVIWTHRSPVTKWETIEWLKKHNVPYNKIMFDKQKYDLIIDDKAYPSYNFLTSKIIEEYAESIKNWDFAKGGPRRVN